MNAHATIVPADNAPDPIDTMIGIRVRVRRKSLGMSQTELGNRLGVTFQQVQKYERGVNRIAGSTMVRAAKALDTTVSALLGEAETGALAAARRERAAGLISVAA